MADVKSSREFAEAQQWVIGLGRNPVTRQLEYEQIEELRRVLAGTPSFAVETQAVHRGVLRSVLEELVWLRGRVDELESGVSLAQRMARGEGLP